MILVQKLQFRLNKGVIVYMKYTGLIGRQVELFFFFFSLYVHILTKKTPNKGDFLQMGPCFWIRMSVLRNSVYSY